MNSAGQRVSVVEVGSRAVRLLVVDVDPGGVRPVLTKSREVRLMSAVNGAPAQASAVLDAANRAIEELEILGKQHNPDRTIIFGTEALRRLHGSARLDPASALARVRVLNPEEEARCSAMAALSVEQKRKSPAGSFLVVDQGGGSVEVITGQTKPSLQILGSESLDLGGDELLRRFANCDSSIEILRGEVRRQIGALHTSLKSTAAFAQGSVATKCAWLSHTSRGDRYDPKLAQGRRLTVAGVNTMVEFFAKAPKLQFNRMRATFDPVNPKSDDIERVVTGAIVLVELMSASGVEVFTVSANGTRHGMAMMMLSDAL